MADEITPNKETTIIEPSNEPIQAPEAIPEPVTAQIPASEPLATEPEPIAILEVKAEPVIEIPPEESPVSAPLPQEIPPAPEIKSIPETIATPIVVASSINPIRSLLEKARNAIQSRKRKKLDRILNMFTNKSKITNDDVEKFLHVSDATATRYLEILEKENKIKQSGKTGKAVSYSKI